MRIFTGGLPPLVGKTILEKRRYMQHHLDDIRKALMWNREDIVTCMERAD